MRFQDLLAYKKSFALGMFIFEESKGFPNEEKFSLTDQIRRSSRSVIVTITESYRKRVYPKNFLSKLTDAEAENSETQVWLDFSLAAKMVEKISKSRSSCVARPRLYLHALAQTLLSVPKVFFFPILKMVNIP